ncbi:MAG TPA: PTS sugar transporter subunit IIA, partial [Longimicrobiaceae bacterium]|nr:PTS sugar transporter subunit IIA [Longimicrobiaceae bacterium]
SRLEMPRDEVFRLLWERERSGSTVLTPGVAIPHILVPGSDVFDLLVVRARRGVEFPGQTEAVYAIFILVSSVDQRTVHLRVLSALAQVINQPRFDEQWLRAAGPSELRDFLLGSERRRF